VALSVDLGGRRIIKKNLDSSLGKILRMTLDGDPAPGNPFRADDDPSNPRSYVFAYGFRNPFSLAIVEGRVFVADNGKRVDAFYEVGLAENRGWRGSDWAIGMNAAMVFWPSVAPVQLAWMPPDAEIFPPRYRGRFYVATSGRPAIPGPSTKGEKAVLVLDYDLRARRMRREPWHLMRYQGEGHQSVVGVAVGPDGLYVVPLFPNERGESFVLKIVPDPEDAFPYRIRKAVRGEPLLRESGCLDCHTLTQRAAAAPSLEPKSLLDRLEARLDSPEYHAQVAEVDALAMEPFVSYRAARREVLEGRGSDRLRRWITYHLLEPRFDSPFAQMPQLQLDEGQAVSIAEWLVRKGRPRVGRRRRAAQAGLAAVLALGLAAAAVLVRRRVRG
jgi:hypothetical protein